MSDVLSQIGLLIKFINRHATFFQVHATVPATCISVTGSSSVLRRFFRRAIIARTPPNLDASSGSSSASHTGLLDVSFGVSLLSRRRHSVSTVSTVACA